MTWLKSPRVGVSLATVIFFSESHTRHTHRKLLLCDLIPCTGPPTSVKKILVTSFCFTGATDIVKKDAKVTPVYGSLKSELIIHFLRLSSVYGKNIQTIKMSICRIHTCTNYF